MDFYTHMQHVQHKQAEAAHKYWEREQRSIALEILKRFKMPFTLWHVIRVWFVVRYKAQSTDEAHTMFISYLQSRKRKAE